MYPKNVLTSRVYFRNICVNTIFTHTLYINILNVYSNKNKQCYIPVKINPHFRNGYMGIHIHYKYNLRKLIANYSYIKLKASIRIDTPKQWYGKGVKNE